MQHLQFIAPPDFLNRLTGYLESLPGWMTTNKGLLGILKESISDSEFVVVPLTSNQIKVISDTLRDGIEGLKEVYNSYISNWAEVEQGDRAEIVTMSGGLENVASLYAEFAALVFDAQLISVNPLKSIMENAIIMSDTNVEAHVSRSDFDPQANGLTPTVPAKIKVANGILDAMSQYAEVKTFVVTALGKFYIKEFDSSKQFPDDAKANAASIDRQSGYAYEKYFLPEGMKEHFKLEDKSISIEGEVSQELTIYYSCNR